MTRNHSFARRRGWLRSAERVGERWRAHVGLVLVAAAAVTAFAVVPGLPVRLLYCGIIAGAVLTLLLTSVSGFDDPVMLGSMAEEWTVEAFAKKKWPTVSNLVFTDGDLDHLVVAPCGVLAVETKYRFRQPEKGRLAKQRRADLAAAQRAGRKAALLLRSRNIDSPAPVTPVLVIWGPGRPDLREGYRVVDGVHILDGDTPQLWAHLFSAPRLDQAERATLSAALLRFRDTQHQHPDAAQRSLRRQCWTQFRASVHDSEQLRRANRSRAAALRSRHAAAD